MTPDDFWAEYARSYDLIWDSPVTAQTRDALHAHLPSDAVRVIDLGCGTGLMSQGLVARGLRVVGVDSSGAMLQRARNMERITEAVEAPAQAVPLDADTADAVIIGNLLHLHPAPAAVLDEARRLARPGAPIIATWPVPGLDLAAMWRVERRTGRSAASTLRAQAHRVRIGLLAASTKGVIAARAAGQHDTAGLLDALGLGSGYPIETVAGCQQLVVIAALE